MKIWFISDTHNQHQGLQIPQADLVIHCGDESTQRQEWLNEPEARRFFQWYEELPIQDKIYVPGNHSTAVEQGLVRPEDYPQVTFLIHEQTEWNGVNIFGSPYTPEFYDWAYMKPRLQLDTVWQSVPDDIDIFITHGPPKGFFDVTRDRHSGEFVHVGSSSLQRHVAERMQPRIHAFGHIHDEQGIRNYGRTVNGSTLYLNCSCCDLHGRLKNHGLVVDIHL